MTIDEAIRVLEKQRYSFPTDEMRVINEAVLLGIEALKDNQAMRSIGLLSEHYLLPSETKE